MRNLLEIQLHLKNTLKVHLKGQNRLEIMRDWGLVVSGDTGRCQLYAELTEGQRFRIVSRSEVERLADVHCACVRLRICGSAGELVRANASVECSSWMNRASKHV